MSDELFYQDLKRSRGVEETPEAVGAGRVERSEPERSDGERSGTRPAPTASPPTAPPTVAAAIPAVADVPVEADADDAEGRAPEREAGPAFGAESFAAGLPPLSGRGRRLVKPEANRPVALTAEQRLLLLDTWQRSGLPAGDFAALVGVSKHTLYAWKNKFDALGPAGLMDRPRGAPRGTRLPELTR